MNARRPCLSVLAFLALSLGIPIAAQAANLTVGTGSSQTLTAGTYSYTDVLVQNGGTLYITGSVQINASTFTVEAGGHRQAAEVTNVASYLSSNDIRLHIGLGAATSASRITIRWPSGKTQTLTNVAANQILNVQEP